MPRRPLPSESQSLGSLIFGPLAPEHQKVCVQRSWITCLCSKWRGIKNRGPSTVLQILRALATASGSSGREADSLHKDASCVHCVAHLAQADPFPRGTKFLAFDFALSISAMVSNQDFGPYVGVRIGEAKNPGPTAYGSHRTRKNREAGENDDDSPSSLSAIFDGDFKQQIMVMIKTMVMDAIKKAITSMYGTTALPSNFGQSNSGCGKAATPTSSQDETGPLMKLYQAKEKDSKMLLLLIQTMDTRRAKASAGTARRTPTMRRTSMASPRQGNNASCLKKPQRPLHLRKRKAKERPRARQAILLIPSGLKLTMEGSTFRLVLRQGLL